MLEFHQRVGEMEQVYTKPAGRIEKLREDILEFRLLFMIGDILACTGTEILPDLTVERI